jgi:hypothetical protein
LKIIRFFIKGPYLSFLLLFLPGQREDGANQTLGKRQKRLDIFFAGVLIKVALNEYSFSITGGGAELLKKFSKIQGKAAALPVHGE